MKGFLPLQREFFDHWLWAEEARSFSKAEAFLDLLQSAAYRPHKKLVGAELIELQPGEVCGAERYLAGRWKWSSTKVRRFLNLLESERMVIRRKKQGVTVITISDWVNYEGEGNPKKAPEKHSKSTSKAPGKRIEEGEELEQGKESPFAPSGAKPRTAQNLRITWTLEDGFDGITEEDFARWAEAYPAVDHKRQIARASEWLRSNPRKAKRNFEKFLTSWLDREQEKGGNVRSNPPDPGMHPPTPLEAQIGRLFGRSKVDPWSAEESALLAALGEIPTSDLELLARYYLAEIAPDADYRCHSVGALLRNWNREKDKARVFTSENP
jgi:hypothetical protein